MSDTGISDIRGRRIWDSRGRPTVEVEVSLHGGAMGRAIAPAGASTGTGEALDRRDGGTAFGGYDVQGAIDAVNGEIADALYDGDAEDQAAIDARLIVLDGTEDKSNLGGNAMIATSMAVAHAAAASAGMPLWRYLGGAAAETLPLPEIQIFGGGAHAAGRVDIQDFMVIAVGAADYEQALDWTAEVYRAAGALMDEAGLLQGVADEGGFWPAFDSNEQALDMLLRAIERAGYRPGEQVAISLDVAASEFGRDGRYRLGLEGRELDSDGLGEMLLSWLDRYPIVSIEDPLAEDDEAGLIRFTAAAGERVQIIGDDFLVTERGAGAARGRGRRVQRGAGQAQSGRHAHGDARGVRCRPRSGMGRRDLGTVRRDRRRDDRPSRGRLGRLSAQGGIVCPVRAHGKVERGAAHRRSLERPWPFAG